MKCSFQHFVFNMSLAFEMNSFECERGLFQKLMTHKLCQNVNFENGGTTIQICILHVMLNILSKSLLFRVHGTSGYFEVQKSSHVILRFEEN